MSTPKTARASGAVARAERRVLAAAMWWYEKPSIKSGDYYRLNRIIAACEALFFARQRARAAARKGRR